MHWYDAQRFCRLKYTDLATVHNMFGKDLLVKTVGGDATYCWIGLQKGSADTWVWSDGRGRTLYTKWDEGEPNNAVDERCVQIVESGAWNDAPCEGDSGVACYERE